MVLDHSIFTPPSEDQKIWRYIDFTKFVDLLNSRSLYFARSDFFEDTYEGSLPLRATNTRDQINAFYAKKFPGNESYEKEFTINYTKNLRKEIAINCWHMNNYESAAMWKLYLKSNEGIAIQSTYVRLKNCLNNSPYVFFVGKVNYIDYDKGYMDPFQVLNAYIHKRMSFEHEKEIRAVLYNASPQNDKINLENGGCKVLVNMVDLIENIFVSPDSPRWLTKLVEDVSIKYCLNVPVINSRIKGDPLF